MNLTNLSGGLLFLAFFSGAGTFIFMIATLCAYDSRKDYANKYLAITVILAILFLMAGFFGFATMKK